MKISIRLATKTDIIEIENILEVCWIDTYCNQDCGLDASDINSKKFGCTERVKKWEQSLKDKSYRLWITLKDNKIIGFCGCKRNELINDLSVIYILPEFQNRGVGKKLIEKALKWLDKNRLITVNMAKCNKNAIEFYKKLGFSGKKEIAPSFLPNGKILKVVQMIKEPEDD